MNIPDNSRRYAPGDRMRDLIRDNSLILMVMNRFGIPMGFGDRSVQDLCAQYGVHASTFLAVANFISGRRVEPLEISAEAITGYLRRAHTYFIDYNLPLIRRKLIDAIDCSGRDELAMLILKFYDEYVLEVERHMSQENDTVFAYVDSLLAGRPSQGYSISDFAAHHHHINDRLEELKDIVVRYYPGRDDNDKLTSVLFDIITCEQDITSHCAVEDRLFVPAVLALEKAVASNAQVARTVQPDADADKADALSAREKDIVVCVAKGMSNKEIADALCLSVNTVTTHRRNISAKLQIHSPAGLAIYAVVNKLVDISALHLS